MGVLRQGPLCLSSVNAGNALRGGLAILVCVDQAPLGCQASYQQVVEASGAIRYFGFFKTSNRSIEISRAVPCGAILDFYRAAD